MPQILNLLLLLPKDLPKLICGVTHVLKHLAEFVHRLGCLIKDSSSRLVVHLELVDLLPAVVDLPISVLNLGKYVLGFELRRPPLLIHDLDRLLLVLDLPIDVLKLTTQPLRNLRLLQHPCLQLLVLHHLLGS